jgi:hypothetical protein
MKFFVPFVLFAALVVGSLLTGESVEAGLVRRDCCCKAPVVVVEKKCDCSGRRHPLRDALKELRKSKCCGEVATTCTK